ncbi:YisL family protein [Salisediminibacterium selenitireducens]|uniref:Uncharacterized protein n=1 Tax=Bacillus selenitireducens (strain ATCC 700615 / DSM 15326 / MLS10) TaxID=439292 RepID=D6XT47_BACIE|nr:YisL family protein [Salisediminibacterium selenitireducens]ADH98983.1 protein of unknown function DUF1516 [[Bacillus] selenitireducens MLS10]
MIQHYSIFLHSHALFWLIAIVLFILTTVMIRNGKQKPAKIMQMSLRLVYLLVFGTGLTMIFLVPTTMAIVKGILAFVLIYVMEMISLRMSKGTLTKQMATRLWAAFVVLLVVVLYFGYFLT